MQYDDASWHSGKDLADDLPPESGATHVAMFVAWAMLSGLGDSLFLGVCSQAFEKLRSRSMTPRAFFLNVCGGKFTPNILNGAGNAFASIYYAGKTARYLNDYESTLGKGLPTLYHVEDSWENFSRLKPVLDRELARWKNQKSSGYNLQLYMTIAGFVLLAAALGLLSLTFGARNVVYLELLWIVPGVILAVREQRSLRGWFVSILAVHIFVVCSIGLQIVWANIVSGIGH